MPYRRRYRSSFANAFEIYITILRSIEKLVGQDDIQHPTKTRTEQELEDKIVDEDDGYITKADDPQLEKCASNWKAAVSMEKKRMWGVFDETGIFASSD